MHGNGKYRQAKTVAKTALTAQLREDRMFWNTETNELVIKVVFFGPEGAGKRTILAHFAGENVSPAQERRSPALVDGDGSRDVDKFSFLSVGLKMTREPDLKFLLFSVHSESEESHRLELMKGTDVFVLVVDSQISQVERAIRAGEKLQNILSEITPNANGRAVVLQLNKRDLASTLSTDEYRALFPWIDAHVEGVASAGIGAREALQAALRILDFSSVPQMTRHGN